jgi:peptide/nickel transport system permease protein
MRQRTQRLLAALRTPVGVLALIACLSLVLLTVFAPSIWGDAAAMTDTEQISKGPSAGHVFGTDGSGRDILLRTLVATQLSVVMALTATAVGVAGGVLVGLLPLIVGGRIGRLIVAAINIGVAFPSLLLAIAFSVILGQSGAAATFAIAIAMVPNYGRFTHNLAASVWGRDYVSAARVLGLPRWRAVFRHVLPNVRDPLLVNAAISAGSALLAFAGLSFLGLGIQVPEYDWGRMLNEGMTRIFVTPAAALVPGVAIILAGLTFVLLGEMLGKALTPSTHRRLTSQLRSSAPKGEGAEQARPVDDGAVLSVRNLRVAAPGGEDEWRPLVHGVSFDVGRGDIVGVVGESGSGKSVTLMAVAGLLDSPLHVAADAAQFDGQALTLKTGAHASSLDHHLGRRLAMIFQDPMSSLNPALSVGSQVAEPGVLHLEMSRAEAKVAAIERLEAVRIPDAKRRYGQYPHEYSGGMRQRAMIAAGLMGTPALILADEPTTALDVTVQAEILDQLRRVNEEHGTAIVLVSHDIAVITSLCTRVLVMYRGRLVEDVSTADLKAGRARHDYTRALLATVPTMSTPRDQPMASIPEDADFSGDTEGAGVEVLRAGDDPALIAEFGGPSRIEEKTS